MSVRNAFVPCPLCEMAVDEGSGRLYIQLKSYIGIGRAPGRKQPVVLIGISNVALSQATLDMLKLLRLSIIPPTAGPTV